MSSTIIKHAIVSTDVVVLTFKSGQLHTVLIDVKNDTYKGLKAFPGGLVNPSESALDAAMRVLREKVGMGKKSLYIEELGAYSEVDRDKRGRVVSIAYICLVDSDKLDQNVLLTPLSQVKTLAYDHDQMKKDATRRLRERFASSTIAQQLVPSEFTMPELYNLYCIVMGKEIDKRNFMKKIKMLDVVESSGGEKRGLAHRPAKLYSFKEKNVKQLDFFRSI